MAISYYVRFQDEKPYQISGEVLFKHYIKNNTTISNISAEPNRLTIYLGDSQIHQSLEIEPGASTSVTFRHFIRRMR